MDWDRRDAAEPDDTTAEQLADDAADEAAYNDELRGKLSEQFRRVAQAVEAVISANTGGGHDWHVAANAWVVETRRMDDIMRRYGCLNSEVRL